MSNIEQASNKQPIVDLTNGAYIPSPGKGTRLVVYNGQHFTCASFADSAFPHDPAAKDHGHTIACRALLASLMEKCDGAHGENGLVAVLAWEQDRITNFLAGTQAANVLAPETPKANAIILNMVLAKLREMDIAYHD